MAAKPRPPTSAPALQAVDCVRCGSRLTGPALRRLASLRRPGPPLLSDDGFAATVTVRCLCEGDVLSVAVVTGGGPLALCGLAGVGLPPWAVELDLARSTRVRLVTRPVVSLDVPRFHADPVAWVLPPAGAPVPAKASGAPRLELYSDERITKVLAYLRALPEGSHGTPAAFAASLLPPTEPADAQ